MHIGRGKNEVLDRDRNIHRIILKIIMRAALRRISTGDNDDWSGLDPSVKKTVTGKFSDRIFRSYNDKPPALLIRPGRCPTRAVKDVHEFFLLDRFVTISSDTTPGFDDISKFHSTTSPPS